jgi:L-ribulose-5-phosphate 3-epimerase
MPGLGIFSWFSYQLPIQVRLEFIKNVGFNATSLWWGDEPNEDKNSQPELARRIGLEIDYIHAPANNPNDLWYDGIDGDDYLNLLISCIDDCSKHDINAVVAHITRLSSKPLVSEIGLNRIKKLVDYAEKKQVFVALENMNSIPHLDFIFRNIQSKRLGFCYDSGHEFCNHPNADCLSRYGDKLFTVHLADNFGDDDTHLLPFDGAINWDKVMLNLKRCKEVRYLTLEADFNRNHKNSLIYSDLSAIEFLTLAHSRLLKLINIFNQNN